MQMFFVSTVEENDYKILEGGAWGYFNDLESAIDAVHRNVTDMHETIYPYAVIERLEQGLFPAPKERLWFGWREEEWGFYEIETPDFANKYPNNFSIAMGEVGNKDLYFDASIEAAGDNSYYFIAVMSHNGDNSRHCGFFKNRETALSAVRENWGDMHNDKYDIALVEHITSGILPAALERVWFEWDYKKGGYVETKPPKKFEKYPLDYSIILA